MNWKAITRLFCAAALWCAWALAEGRTPDEVRSILEAVVDTEYCGTAIANGLGVGTALKGRSPAKGRGFITVEEEEWGPVLLEMAKAETEQYLAVSKLGTLVAMALQNTSNAFSVRLSRMLALMQTMTICKDEALEIVEKIALECSHSDGLGIAAILAWMRLTLSEGDTDRCLQLASKFRNRFGQDSAIEWELCCLLIFPGLEWCDSPKSKETISQWLLTMIEQCGDYSRCNRFDREAAERLDGWVGSVQRKRLAERFRNQPVRGRFVEWNDESGKWERTPPTEADVAEMLASRAAAELATEDSALTDLREAYGDWTQKEEEE